MRMTLGFGAVAAAGMLALAGGASASPVTYIYKGKITEGTDITGVFLDAPGQFAATPFTAYFFRDDATPGALPFEQPGNRAIYGSGDANPVHGVFVVGGASWSFGGDTGIQQQWEYPDHCGPGCDQEGFLHYATNSAAEYDASETVLTQDTGYLFIEGDVEGRDVLSGPDYRTLGDITAADLDRFYGTFSFEYSAYDEAAGQYLFRQAAAGSLAVDSLTVLQGLPGATVPEPASWALMILGFGAAGACLRRRRAAVA